MDTLSRKTSPIRMRNYGRILQDMIDVAAKETNVDNQQRMIVYIAQCMRQKNLLWNRDQESGISRIKEDIVQLSDNRISCDFPAFDIEMQKPVQRFDRQDKKHK